jgi:uncharacterized delta-60 repeat protein
MKNLNLSTALLLVAFCCTTDGFAAIDRSFKPGTGIAGGDEEGVHVIVPLADGRILLGGDFSTYNGILRPNLVLLRPNGSLDPGIHLPGGVSGRDEPAIRSAGFQSDGKIIISGNFDRINGVASPPIARLHPDGTPDTAWSPHLRRISGGVTRSIVLPDGRILVRSFTAMERLNVDGSADTTFNIALDGFGLNGVSLQSDGRILLARTLFPPAGDVSWQKVVRLNPDGSFDSTFDPPEFEGGVSGAEQMPDGRIVVFGGFTAIDGRARPGLALLHSDGRLDTTARFASQPGYVQRALPLSDGGIVAYTLRESLLPNGREVTLFTEPPRGQRLQGRPWRAEFTVYPNGAVIDIAEDSRGRILIAGEFWAINGIRVPTGIARLRRR